MYRTMPRLSASLVLLVLPLLGGLGCRTLKDGTEQEVALDSTPRGATVVIDNEEDEDEWLVTPVRVKLDRGENHKVEFRKEGYASKFVTIKRVASGKAKGIVAGIGLAADRVSGAAYTLVPDQVHVELTRRPEIARRSGGGTTSSGGTGSASAQPVKPAAPAVQPPQAPSTETARVTPPAEAPTARTMPAVNGAPATAVRGNRYAVVIGVADYKFAGNGGLSRLAFADKDARDFAETLVQIGWSQDNIKLLTNDQATKPAVMHALQTWLRRAGKNDTIVLFWSGHGWPDPEDAAKAYFACYDSRPSDPSSGYRMDYVKRDLEDRQPKNVIVIADTCHSGAVVRASNSRAISVQPALDAMEDRQEIPKGWIFIASAAADRTAFEDAAWQNGALTHLLLEGLGQGKADGYKNSGAPDSTVTLRELKEYVTVRMQEEGDRVFSTRLFPQFYSDVDDPGIWDLSLEAPE